MIPYYLLYWIYLCEKTHPTFATSEAQGVAAGSVAELEGMYYQVPYIPSVPSHMTPGTV